MCWTFVDTHIAGSSTNILTMEIFYKKISCYLFSIFLDMEYIILFLNFLNFYVPFLLLKLDFLFVTICFQLFVQKIRDIAWREAWN